MALIFVSVNIVQYPTKRCNACPDRPTNALTPLVNPVQSQQIGACETNNERNQPGKKEKKPNEFHNSIL
ncbi:MULTISPECIES: hypothetical protein [Pontibacter]|uniref:Uncharacterized protein n=1 Tax=Pontibacter lucknowensis TaxID=1077936 RepID=A0A1N6U480_9BACT|nr:MULTISPECIES: hypothetical protein [Pontibacter]SIQ60445.1 hypothetical protein SAMN05421545_0671 [Pontibacter lucknowensis]